MSANDGRFKRGEPSRNSLPVGSVTIRTRWKRGEVRRAWVKVAEPNVWRLRAQIAWESANQRPLPRGSVVHHKDENPLNDDPSNLEALTKSEHLAKHREEYTERALESFAVARRELKWSTKSKTGKRTGRHPKNCDCPLHAAA